MISQQKGRSHHNPMAHRFEMLPFLVFHLVTSSVLGCVPYVTIGTFGLGNHCFQMGFCIGTPPSGAQNRPTSFSTNMFILVALRNFKAIRILDKCPFKVGLCIGTPPSSAIPGVCLSAIYANENKLSTSKNIHMYIYKYYRTDNPRR